jgi:hypothetical protein
LVRSTAYYVRRVQTVRLYSGYMSWNWPALFVPLLWMLYRKMWLWAAVYFFGTPVALGLLFGILLLVLPETTAATVGWTIQAVFILIVLPMYANALYYQTCQARIAEAKNYRVERRRQLERLWNMGGTSNVA